VKYTKTGKGSGRNEVACGLLVAVASVNEVGDLKQTKVLWVYRFSTSRELGERDPEKTQIDTLLCLYVHVSKLTWNETGSCFAPAGRH